MGVTREILLRGSRSRWLAEQLTRRNFTRKAVRRFMPGEKIEDALEVAETLQQKGMGTILTLLGENVSRAEEAETVVLPQHGRRAARRWFWWQAVTSASPMHVRRCARDVGMNRQRWIVVVAILVFGPLMVLDAGINTAPGTVIGLAAVAIAIPAAAGLLSGNLRVHAVAAIVSTVLLIAARLASGLELRWYAIPWLFFVLLHLNWRYEHRIVSSGDGGGQATPSSG